MVDLYSTIVDNYNKVVLQSTGYYLFLKGGQSGTRPSTSVLKLRLGSQSGNPSRVARFVDEISNDARINTQVPHLEREKVFGSPKRKLDFPPRDDGNSHCHDCINFNVPKLAKKASPGQCRATLMSLVVSATEHLASPTASSTSQSGPVWSKNGFPIVESPCTNLMDCKIERILSSLQEQSREHFANGLKCNTKIAKYHRVVAAPTFIGIQCRPKSHKIEQMQF